MFLYIAVPDMMNPTGSLKFDWFRTVHTYYFNKETLFFIMNKAGFSSSKINFSRKKCHLKVTSLWPVSNSQTFKVLSSDEDTILQESACKHLMTPVWPSEVIQSKVLEQRPVSKSHNLMVLTNDPEIILVPKIKKKIILFP